MHITTVAGGVGGARFLRGLLDHLDHDHGDGKHTLTVVVNTGDDITLHGLRVCPDLDSVTYTLGGGIHEQQGWGRADETFTTAEEFAAYGEGPAWFTLGDRDLATHVVRTRLLNDGLPLHEVTARLTARWHLDRPSTTVRLLPMTDDTVETHVDLVRPEHPDQVHRVHFQEWWVRLHAAVPALRIVPVGAAEARPAPGVLEALVAADVVLLPPSNPVVSVGTVLAVPGVRETLRACTAPVVGVSPVIGGAPVRGMADACLTAIGVPTAADAVAGLYADLLDGWLVAPVDASGDYPPGLVVETHPLLMGDRAAAADLAGAALDLAVRLRAGITP